VKLAGRPPEVKLGGHSYERLKLPQLHDHTVLPGPPGGRRGAPARL